MTIALLRMIVNSNDLTNIFTLEGFLLFSIFHRRKSPYSQISHYIYSDLQQQARPVWNTEERELNNFWIILPVPHWRKSSCKRGNISVWPGREGNPGIRLQSRTFDRKRMMMITMMIWTPVHLPMGATETIRTPNCEEAIFPDQCTCCQSTMFQSQLRATLINHNHN